MGASASREKFRESVAALIEVDVSPDDAEFWDELWKIPSSTEEVFELISPEAARKLRDERFDNLATLFTQATAQLCQIVETPYSIYFDQALNCVRVLTRVLPFLLEKGDLGESDENVENLCWSTAGGGLGDDDQSEKDSILGKLIGSDDDLSAHRETKEEDGQEPLALLVVHAAMHMLFLPQFTCDFFEEQPKDGASQSSSRSDEKIRAPSSPDDDEDLTEEELEMRNREEAFQNKENKAMKADAGLGSTRVVENGILLLPRPASIVWASGCGMRKKVNEANSGKFDKNRVEVLRLLLAACCDPLFSPADEYNPLASRWLAIAVAADAPNAICLFYSLLNTVISYEPNQGYSGGFTNDAQAKLVRLSIQVLCVLLDCGLSGNPKVVLNETDEPVAEFEDAAKAGFNIFRTLLARIDSGKELTLIFNGLARLIRNVYESQKGILIKSGKGLQFYQEILVLFWKLLEENPLFMNIILTQCDVTEIVTPICYLMYQARKDPPQIGLVHICTFVLLKLSGERSFGVSLNKPFGVKLPCDIPLFRGGHADLISVTLHKIIVNGSHKFVPLYSCFLTIICNVSPYWRSMSLVAAVKLVNLFELFSSPKFLFSGDQSHRHLAILLEVFNNVIQYQYNGNQHLMYAIIRRKDSFGRLAAMTLQKAMSQFVKAYGNETLVAGKGQDIVSMKEVDNRGNPVNKDGNQSDDSSIVGEHTFTPSEEWISELKEILPFETISRLLQHLVPVVDDVVNRKEGVVDEGEILDILKDVTMVGLLPVPHAIVIRKYQPNQFTSLWFTAYLWGVIFTGNQSLPIFDGQVIQLFQVSVDPEDLTSKV